MEDEDFLAAVEADNANEPVIEPAPEPVVEAPAAPAEPEQPAPAAEPANPLTPPVVDVKPEPGFVPISALLDTRDKLRERDAEIARLREQQPQPQAQPIPDPLDDPEGFASYQSASAHTAALNVKLDMSEEFVRQQRGDEIVDKARDWAMEQFQRRPGFQQEVLSQRNPYSYVVQQYEREQIASNVTADDFAQFQAWKQAQAQLTQQQQPAAPAAPLSPAAPPRSLASAPAAGGMNTEVAQSDDEIFAETFARK
jgi:hypothetical protein